MDCLQPVFFTNCLWLAIGLAHCRSPLKTKIQLKSRTGVGRTFPQKQLCLSLHLSIASTIPSVIGQRKLKGRMRRAGARGKHQSPTLDSRNYPSSLNGEDGAIWGLDYQPKILYLVLPHPPPLSSPLFFTTFCFPHSQLGFPDNLY